MYRFIRTAIVRNAAAMPSALKFASEVTTHLNKRYALNIVFGFELYGDAKVHWHFDMDSLDKMQTLNAGLMEDRDYLALLEKGAGLWAEGTMKDTLVSIAA